MSRKIPLTVIACCGDEHLPFSARVADDQSAIATALIDLLSRAARVRDEFSAVVCVGGLEPRVLSWNRILEMLADAELEADESAN